MVWATFEHVVACFHLQKVVAGETASVQPPTGVRGGGVGLRLSCMVVGRGNRHGFMFKPSPYMYAFPKCTSH